MNTFEKIQFQCLDGYTLTGYFYPATGHSQQKNPILLSPATGITKNFYHSFAQWLSQEGFDVLSFDFRGIGESLHGALKYNQASIDDWGTLDIPAAIDTLLIKTQKERVILVGHSAGGQLLGLCPNHYKVKKVIAVAGSSGYIKGLKGRTKLLAPVMFNIVFPISNFFKGYGATQILGMGENLPKKVARQWREFCSQPGYVLNAIGKTIQQDYHEKISCPIVSIWATDDEIATEANVRDFLRIYPNAKTHMVDLHPQKYGVKQIGHMSMFKKSHQQIWPTIKMHILN